MHSKLMVLVFVTAFSSAAFGTSLLVNESFESGHGGSGYVLDTHAAESVGVGDSAAITGWTVFNGNLVVLSNGAFLLTPRDGNFALDLTGYDDDHAPHGGIQQDIPTVIGSAYKVTFSVGAASSGTSTVRATAGAATLDASHTYMSGNVWEDFSLNFTATSTTTTVSFLGIASSNGGSYIGLDAGGVTLVPEPGSASIVLSAALALFPRRRR